MALLLDLMKREVMPWRITLVMHLTSPKAAGISKDASHRWKIPRARRLG
jgi:hypothetical protein